MPYGQMPYDHCRHAGNAGDVWKHLVLAEAAEHLLSRGRGLTYAESHAGYPEYLLTEDIPTEDIPTEDAKKGPTEWTSGIGRLWPPSEALLDCSYFQVLASMNPGELCLYPGSACLVLELAHRSKAQIAAHLWDLSLDVADSWDTWTDRHRDEEGRMVSFHLGDGFSGVRRLLDRSGPGPGPGLLLIDSPYKEAGDVGRSEELFCDAVSRGWTVLCWYMDQVPEPRCDYRVYELEFEKAKMDTGRWKSASVALAGDRDLEERLDRISSRFCPDFARNVNPPR